MVYKITGINKDFFGKLFVLRTHILPTLEGIKHFPFIVEGTDEESIVRFPNDKLNSLSYFEYEEI